MAYVSSNQIRYSEMEDDFRRCETEEAMRLRILIYTFNMAYDRGDLMQAWSVVEREKGWRIQ